MKHFLVLLWFPLVANAQISAVRGSLDCPDITNSLKCARSVEGTIKAPYLKRVDDSLLVIALESGEERNLRDGGPTEARTVHYSAIATSRDNRYVVLHRQFYEGAASSILDRRTGRESRLDGVPVFSPDTRWLATVNADLAAGYSPNVLRIYRMTEQGPVIAHDAEPGNWGALDAVWTSPDTLDYLRATFDCYESQHGKGYTCLRETLRFDGTRWR